MSSQATKIGIALLMVGAFIFFFALVIGSGWLVSDVESATLREILRRPIGEQPTGAVLLTIFLIVLIFGRD